MPETAAGGTVIPLPTSVARRTRVQLLRHGGRAGCLRFDESPENRAGTDCRIRGNAVQWRALHLVATPP